MHLHVGRCRRFAPLPEPPSWADQEWCDEGASCEHPRCLNWLHDGQDEARAAAES